VDQEFKNVLRAQMLSKISAAPVRKEVVREKHNVLPEKRGFDFAEFFNTFRYPLAIVPSMLLLVVVAISAMKLPVSIKNEVTVPTPTPVQNDSAQNSDTMNASENFESGAASEQRVKTFSGSSVLPSSYRNGGAMNTSSVISNPQNLNFDLGDSVQNKGAQNSTAQQNAFVPEQPSAQKVSAPQGQNQPSEQNVNPFNMMVQSFLEPQQKTNNGGDAQNFSDETTADQSIQTVPFQADANVPVVSGQQQAQAASQPQVEVSQNSFVAQPSEQTVTPLAVQKTVQPAVNDALKIQLNTAQPALDIQAQQPAQTVSQPLQTTDLQLNVNTVNTQAPIVRVPLETLNLAPQYTVYYGADVADSDKAALETEALAAVSGKDVTFLSVMNATDSNVVEVEYTFADGTTATKLFKRLDTGWHLAKYVQRYFYDNGFQYQTAN
jgi:hypothetical protein